MAKKPYRLRCNYTGGRSNKFWEVEVIDVMAIFRWGRIGTAGQAQTEMYNSYDAAKLDAEFKYWAKIRKGYKAEGETRPLAQPTPAGTAAEAIALFQSDNPKLKAAMEKAKLQSLLGSNKPKAKRKPKLSASPKPLNASTPPAKKENDPVFLKPARKVRI